MSNVHTLDDFSEKPNTSALPNPWATNSPGSRADTLSDDVTLPTNYSSQVGYVSLSGEMRYATADSPTRTVGLVCCPCCIDPCSDEQKADYKKMVASFCFVMTVIQLIFLIISLGLGGFESPSNNPMLGPTSEALLKLGALYGPLIRYSFQVWRFFTPIVLHGGFIHLLLNGVMQLRFGLFLERQWGLLRFVVIYFLSGLGASLLSLVWNPNGISVGASGALLGVLGAHIGKIVVGWGKLEPTERNHLLIQNLVWLTIIFMMSFSAGVDGAAHLGGLITGFFLGIAIFFREVENPQLSKMALIGASLAVSIYLIVTMICFWTVVEVKKPVA